MPDVSLMPPPPTAPFAPPAEVDETSPDIARQRAEVKRWQERIRKAKERWSEDFKRMRDNMDFTFGFQWNGQTKLNDDRYTNNVTLRMVLQKVASLYAKNPTVEVQPRRRMEFQIWDGDPASVQNAALQVAQLIAVQQPIPPELIALMRDYEEGSLRQTITKKVAETLELLIAYDLDAQKPEFKEQMKQKVARAIVCGVAYAKVCHVDEEHDEGELSSIELADSMTDRAKRARLVMERLENGEIETTDAQVEQLKSMALSLGASAQAGDELLEQSRVVFDFPPSTSLIPSVSTRALSDWVGTTEITQEYLIPLDEANAFFGTRIRAGGEGNAKEFNDAGEPEPVKDGGNDDASAKPLVCLWETYDKRTKTRFVTCDGWPDYVLPPEPVVPEVSGFWPFVALPFNAVPVEQGVKASIFPPSDVDLIRSPQKERNRTRDCLRDHRNASAPSYVIRKGSLSEDDKRRLRDREPNQVIELESIPADVEPSKFILPLQVVGIDPRLYDTSMLDQDVMYSTGSQEANLGPAQPNVTATVGTIAEQSRMVVTSSNVDALDGALSRLVRMAGEIRLRTASTDMVKAIVGPGAVWPEVDRELYVAMIMVQVKAASSGKPNQAVAIANFERLAPVLLNSGANPHAIIEEAVQRLDDRLDVKKFFPVALPGVSEPTSDQSEQQEPPRESARSKAAKPDQPLQQGMPPTAAPVPLAAA